MAIMTSLASFSPHSPVGCSCLHPRRRIGKGQQWERSSTQRTILHTTDQ
uniref:Uncharacterized protein n=1 Tax=Brassica oleracea TaxID=3712 RepID=A0A3P6GYE2_BRAOL|nr:unnamed protein product [Brassica oleracea]